VRLVVLRGPKSERFSGGQSRFVVKALDGGSGNHAFGSEPVQNELSMFPECFGHLSRDRCLIFEKNHFFT
jgi:hypothetical protein